MRPKSLLLLTLALGCGLVASIGISQILDRKGGSGQQIAGTEPIFVAKVDVNLGEKLTEENLSLEEWPKDKIPAGSMRRMEDLEGRRPRTKLYKGEPILDAKLLASDARDNPAQQVPPGYRVVSVRVDAHTGIAGLLRPGDRVDVQLFVKKDARTGITEATTKTILKEIRVFAVDQDFRRTSDEDETSPARTVSLVVTPEQADKLTLASRLGEINLIMRNPDDTNNIASPGASVNDLLVTSHANRDDEQGDGDGRSSSTSQGAILDFLKGIKDAAAAASATTAAPDTVTQVASSGPWTIMLLEGDDLREVQVKEDGRFPDPFAAAAQEGAGSDPRFIPSSLRNEGDEQAPEESGANNEDEENLDFQIEN
jgi:pilus assembly protein CpaB